MTVFLVGAGPGDPDLLTIRAARLLAGADVVVYDRLIDLRLLDLVGPGAELIAVGKFPGQSCRQDDINRLLVSRADRDTVVRLKGGDPFVFGRGGEEAVALADAGIAYEVVPGLSSVTSVPAAAGIPVTHRGLAASFTVVTGHRQPGAPDVEWEALARVGGTIVVLMGVATRGEIARRLIAGGLAPDTPATAVEWGTHERQRTVRTDLARLGRVDVANPATIVIGSVARLDLRAPRLRASPRAVRSPLGAAAR
ncbi:MAG: uroporphyrinogen-III C-methyltransferase [Acidimicrobiales bacterium]